MMNTISWICTAYCIIHKNNMHCLECILKFKDWALCIMHSAWGTQGFKAKILIFFNLLFLNSVRMIITQQNKFFSEEFKRCHDLNDLRNSHKVLDLNDLTNSHKVLDLNDLRNSHKVLDLNDLTNSHKVLDLKPSKGSKLVPIKTWDINNVQYRVLKFSQVCYFYDMLRYTKWEDWSLTVTNSVQCL